MSWHGNATVGFNAGGTLFENHPLTGTSSANLIACLSYSNTVWTNLVYKLTPSGKFKLYSRDRAVTAIIFDDVSL